MGSPKPGLVTTPTPPPRLSSIPGSSRQETRAVRCAPCVTSGSSPASLMTTASAQEAPTSQRSTVKRTRFSSPLRGSFISTSFCTSPLKSALAAALAAAAAQVPVVQPVLSFSPLTLCMLGGMEGSRILRLGDGILSPDGRRHLGLSERVGEAWAVQVRARPARRQPGSHKDERLPREARLAYPVGELAKRTLDDPLVRPARLVDDGARRLRCVSAF